MINRPLYTKKIMEYVDTPFIKILTGIRRSGKSTILKLVMQNLKERGIDDRLIISYLIRWNMMAILRNRCTKN